MENKFKLDKKSCLNKLKSNVSINVGLSLLPIVSISKEIQITGPHDPEKDAYRKCERCGKHYNLHKNGYCPS
jgi:hypothetical protein